MQRREFITLLGGATVWPLTVRAQKPGKLFRIGYLNAAIPGVLPVEQRAIAAFIMGLAERGLVQDRDFVIEYRYGDNRPDRLAEVAAELVDLKVDVLHRRHARAPGSEAGHIDNSHCAYIGRRSGRQRPRGQLGEARRQCHWAQFDGA
jgi:hypothetical protein